MFNKTKPDNGTLRSDQSYTGETIEQKVHRITINKEPITDGAPLIYTERQYGVQPAYNIRTDRWEIAIDAMDKVTKTELAKRAARLEAQKATDAINNDKTTGTNTGESQNIQGTK